MSLKKMTIIFICLFSISLDLYCLPPKTWGSIEYLYYWASKTPISIPLITANNNPSAFGIINEPGTSIIFGAGSPNHAFDFGGMNGGRLTIGWWVDQACNYGLEGGFWGLEKKYSTFTATSAGGEIPIINIPFFSTESGTEDVLVNRLPNTATVRDGFQSFGFELNGLVHSSQAPFPLIGILGFRHLNIQEHFTLQDVIFNEPSLPNQILSVEDNFSTTNNFYGLQIGARTDFNYSNFNLELTTKIAAGTTHEALEISGQTAVVNQRIIQAIGLFAEPSNIGRFKHNPFAFLPEIIAKLRYGMTPHSSAMLAYNGLYITKIIKAPAVIDRNINASQNPLIGGTGTLTGAASPAPFFNQANLWLQGLSLGLEYSC